ncbi:hypothetical protein Leef1_33 [Polaribacter phage Leef_1]|uniref:Uncharacterized protein n=1 Tax=Polaribacter phage Leef_1 TaxID=2745684 RepID=A0A8E4ZK23_9CAUD|nr:hypothetical protein M1M28_gp33 [Polaribacter phage Leef_1]QQV91398.1 hypothetical protein Leef1_33 [Polaribacter phage Leef_1]
MLAVVIKLIRMNAIENAVVIKVGDRYFNSYKNKRILTAWSLAGANLFKPSDTLEIEKAEKKLKDKGYKTERKFVVVT